MENSGRLINLSRKPEISVAEGSVLKMGVYQTTDAKVQNGQTVAVVLPTYCEAENIESLIRELQELRSNLLITVIDDSSPDGTAEIVRKLQKEYNNLLLFVRPQKLGLGTAIITAFQSILSLKNQPEHIITMDADYSHNPQDIPKLMRAANCGYDLVIGSRYCQGGRIVGWHRVRWLISRIANLIASTVVGVKLHDCTSGLRCYSKNYVKNVLPHLHSQTYEIQIETIKQARARKFHIKEVPITFTNRKRGKSKLTLTEILSFISYITKTKFGLVKNPLNSGLDGEQTNRRTKMKSFNLHRFILGIAFWFQDKSGIRFGDFLSEHYTLLQFFEFCLIGAGGVGVNAFIFGLLLWFNVAFWFSWVLGILAASIFNFVLNKWLVFTRFGKNGT